MKWNENKQGSPQITARNWRPRPAFPTSWTPGRPGLLNFLRWRLRSVGRQYETLFYVTVLARGVLK